MNERETALPAALDDRARQAASSLKAAVAAATGDRDLSKAATAEQREPSGNRVLSKAGDETQSGILDPKRIDEVVVEEVVVSSAGTPRAGDDIAGDDEVVVAETVVHDLAQRGEAPSERVTLGARRVWLAAAAVFVVAFAGVAVVVAKEKGDDRPVEPTTEPWPHQYLVPGWLPDDWDDVVATLPDAQEDVPDEIPEGEVAVYGDTSLDDPWAGSVLTAERYEAAPDDVWQSSDAEQITMLGVPALLREDGAVVTAEPTVSVDDEHQVVTGFGLGQDAVREAAEALDRDLEIDVDSLPDGYEEIARGPVSAAMPLVPTASDGLRIYYGESCGPAECSSGPTASAKGFESAKPMRSSLVLTQRPADNPRAAAVIRTMALDMAVQGYEDDVTEVRGQPAYVLHGPGGYWTATSEDESSADGEKSPDEPELGSNLDWYPIDLVMTHVQWFEPSVGMIVTVSTAGALDEEAIDRFVENLKVVDQDELDALLE